MSILFEPIEFGKLVLPNRFVHTGCYECMAREDGHVSEALARRYGRLGKARIGLVVTGYMFVSQNGKANPFQTGIHNDSMIPGLARIAGAVHEKGGKVAFQLVHAGRQTTRQVCGQQPAGPSASGRDPIYLVKPRQLTDSQIVEIVESYADAAARAAAAGADAIHISAAGGYLLNQFLSPFFNQRQDMWGGSSENRFRLLKEVILAMQGAASKSMPIIVKINTQDATPGEGINLEMAVEYATWLKELGVAALEIASGTLLYSNMQMWRGKVPTREIIRSLVWWKKPLAWFSLKALERRDTGFVEGWNLKDAAQIKAQVPGIPIITVGGMRTLAQMESAVNKGLTDCIGMCRPFLREPNLVIKFQDSRSQKALCESCNLCLGAAANLWPVGCYCKGIPKGKGQTADREQ
jgi:2,4-dienoyl-CoA reductase-like NADH-dependent reductase (Old Yellow Enzyme family)